MEKVISGGEKIKCQINCKILMNNNPMTGINGITAEISVIPFSRKEKIIKNIIYMNNKYFITPFKNGKGLSLLKL
ncbi:MAG: hypothetical protein KAZ04_00110 [Sebaldella sp.]|nr:hypothetical protein [Sebaldella sp.]